MLLRMIEQIKVSGERFRCNFVVFLYVAKGGRPRYRISKQIEIQRGTGMNWKRIALSLAGNK